MFEPDGSERGGNKGQKSSASDVAECYERGLGLRKATLFKQAIRQFEQATADQAHALKAYAQIGLCCKSNGQYEEAVTAFRNALKTPAASTKETVQILYMLGRTLESLDRVAETLEVYRWLRRENPQYRDVAARIESLSTRRVRIDDPALSGLKHRVKQASWAWNELLGNTK